MNTKASHMGGNVLKSGCKSTFSIVNVNNCKIDTFCLLVTQSADLSPII